jgi:phosphoribosylglycinamide formyltransferase 1
MTARLAVLVSGSGSNLQAILDACAAGALDGRVGLVVSNVAGAFALERASAAGVPTCVIERRADEPRPEYDRRLADAVADAQPDWIVLAGWMRLLSGAFLDRFPNRVVNLHPALPGEYPGLHAIERAYADAQAGIRSSTGVMVHLVPDEGVDDGPVLATAIVPIEPGEPLDALATRVHATEHRLLVHTLQRLIQEASHEQQL